MKMITIAWCGAKKGSAGRNELEELETWLVTAEAPREKEQEDGPAWGLVWQRPLTGRTVTPGGIRAAEQEGHVKVRRTSSASERENRGCMKGLMQMIGDR
jgi:hypothetical protein